MSESGDGGRLSSWRNGTKIVCHAATHETRSYAGRRRKSFDFVGVTRERYKYGGDGTPLTPQGLERAFPIHNLFREFL